MIFLRKSQAILNRKMEESNYRKEKNNLTMLKKKDY
jgi:hypothetical protein